MEARSLLRELDRLGVLLLTDPRLPSLVQCLTGKPAAGSWWSHARGREIFAACEALSAHRDVLLVKLVLGKVTFVHRRLWPALWSIATAREPWQWDGLPGSAAKLFERVELEGEVSSGGVEKSAVGSLEERLLVHVRQEHTAAGHHERVLKSWARTARDAKFKPPALRVSRARAQLESSVPAELASERLWPWGRIKKTRRGG